MKLNFGIEFVPELQFSEITRLSQMAEEVGFQHVWITDHYNNRNVWLTLGQIAAATDTIRLGPGVSNPFSINPLTTASAAASLAELSNNRTNVGLGAGDKVTLQQQSIEWKQPLAAVTEAVEIIRTLLKGNRLENYQGKVFQIQGAQIAFLKKEKLPTIPIYIGAQGPKMLAASAQIADGVLINASHPKDFEAASKILRENNPSSGFDIGAYVSFSVHAKEEKARKEARIVVAFIVAGSPKSALQRHSIPVGAAQGIAQAINRGEWKTVISSVTDSMIDAFSVAGTPEKCIDRIEALVGQGVTQFIVGSPIGKDKTGAIELIGKEILPCF